MGVGTIKDSDTLSSALEGTQTGTKTGIRKGQAIINACGRRRLLAPSSPALWAASSTGPRVPHTTHLATCSSPFHTQRKPAFTARPTTPTIRQ